MAMMSQQKAAADISQLYISSRIYLSDISVQGYISVISPFREMDISQRYICFQRKGYISAIYPFKEKDISQRYILFMKRIYLSDIS
jgi:hypothetical protein